MKISEAFEFLHFFEETAYQQTPKMHSHVSFTEMTPGDTFELFNFRIFRYENNTCSAVLVDINENGQFIILPQELSATINGDEKKIALLNKMNYWLQFVEMKDNQPILYFWRMPFSQKNAFIEDHYQVFRKKAKD